MANKILYQSRRGVPVDEAKAILNNLLRYYSKRAIARMSGLSRETLHRIETKGLTRIERSTLNALTRAGVKAK